jgi:hypothetical protein
MANPKEWGPIVWKIIHTCCEHLGTNTNILLQTDEINAYKKFVNQIRFILPCKVCKNHYSKNLIHHKKDLQYNELKEYAKEFFYNIHDSINKEKNIISIPFSSLESTYGTITKEEFNKTLLNFDTLFKKYKLYHFISPESVHDFLKAVNSLRASCNWI